jgi:hypothetical protein
MFIYVMEGFEGTNPNDGNIFPEDFMKKTTPFSSLDEMLKAGGFEVNSMADFTKIPANELSKFIGNQTKFKNWDEMLDTAIQEWTSRELGV